VGLYSAEECRFMDALKPHLQRAAFMSTQLSSLSHAQQLSCELMDQLPFGVMVLGSDGKVLEVNKRAHQLLHGSADLVIQSGQLLIRDKAANTALQKAIASSMTLHTTTHRQNVCIAVPRAGGKLKPLQVMVNPLPRQSAFALRASATLIFLFGEDHAPQLNPHVLSELYRLTPAETQLAVQLAQGHALGQIAATSRTSMNTVRTHLKHLLNKTECATQSQLVRTLLLGPAVMRG
jgi:DNA-binding CsgD family transcriptional regulator